MVYQLKQNSQLKLFSEKMFKISNYNEIKKVISEKYFDQEEQYQNKCLLEVGKTYLELVTKNIIYFEFFKDVQYLRSVQEKIGKIIIDQIKISDQQQLTRSMGNLYRQKNYDLIQSVEQEIKNCIRNYLSKMEEFSNQSKKLVSLQGRKQSQLNYNKNKNISDIAYPIRQNQIDSQKEKVKLPKQNQKKSQVEKKQESYVLKSKHMDEKMQELSQILQLKKKNGEENEDQILLQLIQNLHINQQNQLSSKLVDQFMSKVQNGNTVLNYFLQQFGFSKAQYHSVVVQDKFVVTGTIQFVHRWTGNKNVKYESTFIDTGKKRATQKCSRELISKAFKSYPFIFKDFAEIKKKKGIKF